jgi:hypothetical protein
MKFYRWVWSIFWLVVGAVPVAIGLVVAPVAAFCIGVLTATASATVAAADDRWATDMWLRAGLLGAAAAAVLSRSSDERLELVNLRQAYLDELELRNAFGFDAWLRSGAQPVGNPARFLTLRAPRPSRPGPSRTSRPNGST